MWTTIKEYIKNRITSLITNNLIYSFLLFYILSVATVLGVEHFNFKRDKKIDSNDAASNEETIYEEEIYVEISGAVNKPGVYSVSSEERLASLVHIAEGFSDDASEEWIIKNINLSSKLSDAQKVYIPYIWETANLDEELKNVAVLTNPYVYEEEEQTSSANSEQTAEEIPSSSSINLNTASQEDIDSLAGIGPVYAAKIIENRPYDNYEALLEKAGISKSVLEKIKDRISF